MGTSNSEDYVILPHLKEKVPYDQIQETIDRLEGECDEAIKKGEARRVSDLNLDAAFLLEEQECIKHAKASSN